MKSICVFCGSSKGNDPEILQLARDLGRELIREKLVLVYGGAGVGLMAELANAVLAEGGKVVGVIPGPLFSKEIPHKNLTQLWVTETMHERKQKMYDLADGFIALPGGLGTLDELFEVLTWSQLGLHRKPIGILQVGGYYDALLNFFRLAVTKGFLQPQHQELLMVEEKPGKLLQSFKKYQPRPATKWISEEEL